MFVLLKQRARSSNTFRSTFRSIEGIVTHCLWLLQKSTQRVLPQERTNVQVDRANAIPAGKRGLARLFHADDTTTARARCCGPAAWRQAQKRCRLPCKAGAESLKTGYSSSNVGPNTVERLSEVSHRLQVRQKATKICREAKMCIVAIDGDDSERRNSSAELDINGMRADNRRLGHCADGPDSGLAGRRSRASRATRPHFIDGDDSKRFNSSRELDIEGIHARNRRGRLGLCPGSCDSGRAGRRSRASLAARAHKVRFHFFDECRYCSPGAASSAENLGTCVCFGDGKKNEVPRE